LSEHIRQGDAHALIALERRARFVLDGCDATPWADLPVPSATRRKLKRLAECKGGQPQDWFALPYDVPCRDLPLEIQTLEGRWQEIEQDDLKRCYDDLKVKLGDNGRVEEFQTRRRS